MRKQLLTVTAVLLTLAVSFAGCGKKDNNNTAVSNTTVSVSTSDKEEKETTSDNKKEETDTSVSENEPETEKETTKDIFLRFMDYQEKCAGITDDDPMDLNEIILFYKEANSTIEGAEFYADSVSYGFLDCGNDGNEELLVVISYDASEDEWGFGPLQEYLFFRYDGEKIVLFNEESCYYRTGISVYDSGYYLIGGSNSATSYSHTYKVISAEGDVRFAFAVSDNFVDYQPYVSYFDISSEVRPDDYPMFSFEGDCLFPDDVISGEYLMTTLTFTDLLSIYYSGDESEYEHAKLDNIFFVCGSSGEDVTIPESYKNFYAEMGIELHNASEYTTIVEEGIKSKDIDPQAFDGNYVELTYISLG